MPDKSVEGQPPPGVKLRHTLRGHKGYINRIAWSPDGQTLASLSRDKTIRLWDAETGELCQTLEGHSNRASRVNIRGGTPELLCRLDKQDIT